MWSWCSLGIGNRKSFLGLFERSMHSSAPYVRRTLITNDDITYSRVLARAHHRTEEEAQCPAGPFMMLGIRIFK